MSVSRTERVRHMAQAAPHLRLAPRAAAFCRFGSPPVTRFAPVLLVLVGILPAVFFPAFVFASPFEELDSTFPKPVPLVDADANGVEDLLDQWLNGSRSWEELRSTAGAPSFIQASPAPKSIPASGPWAEGGLRVIRLGSVSGDLHRARERAAGIGRCDLIHSLDRFGGVAVLGVDQRGLAAFLKETPGGRILLDREGVPALNTSRTLSGADQAAAGHWTVGEDWSSSVAILDSGCDTAHGDLGDYLDDDLDGPAPAVGDANDWWPADSGWPTAQRYKVVGWKDVTNDFPSAVGPWDYHHHGTALASVVAGSGLVDPAYRGMAPMAHLTVVKFYDFDETWHTWAGDFLAACDWTLENLDLYRIRTVLMAVNWEVDAGITEAMAAFVDQGVLPVAAMGNFGPESGSGGFPASLADVLTVGAVDETGAVSNFSGRGLMGTDKPDLVAPGGGLLQSGGRITVCDNEPNDSYSGRQGTSLAAAHAAGALTLLNEALRKSGLEMPRDRASTLTRKALLKATCARVDFAENALGTGHEVLPSQVDPDTIRGWGLLRVDAAIEAALKPIPPGGNDQDFISSDWSRLVVARRLILREGINYEIEVTPSSGLDVVLEVVDPRWLDKFDWMDNCIRVDAKGSGLAEKTYFRPNSNQFLVLAVKRVSGFGSVTLKVQETDELEVSRGVTSLPGHISGPPNYGTLAGQSVPSMVVSSLVSVDPQARAVNVLDLAGRGLPDWPVFLFPHISSLGGLTQPLVWDLDGISGDEIVVASAFGSVYFFEGNGQYEEVPLTFNLELTAPVGWLAWDGRPLVTTVDRGGTVHSFTMGSELEWSRDLASQFPLPPAVGQLIGGGSEELVVSFAGGLIAALDYNGSMLAGWPVDLGVELSSPPVLCDMDGDGFHEVIQPVLDQATGTLSTIVLRGNGQPGPGNGAVIQPAGGGNWVAASFPVVAGGFVEGDLRVTLAGLHDNGEVGEDAVWSMGLGQLLTDGNSSYRRLPGFALRGTASAGVLTLDQGFLCPPMCWNSLEGTGSDPHLLAHLRWREVLYGLTSVPGAMTGWLGNTANDRPLSGRQDLIPGGAATAPVSAMGSMLVPLAGEVHLRVEVLDKTVSFSPVPMGRGQEPVWSSARGNSRNSGAQPLRPDMSSVALSVVAGHRIHAAPNPAASRLQLTWSGSVNPEGIVWEIFDLRGHLVRFLRSDVFSGTVMWDATDRAGRPVAAGTYLVRARSGSAVASTRILMQR